MTNLELIEKLERHTGFILDMLTNEKTEGQLGRLRAEFCQIFAHLRIIPENSKTTNLSRSQIMRNMDSWCNIDHIDERKLWE